MKDLFKIIAGTSGELVVTAILIAFIVLLNTLFSVAQPLLITLAVLAFLNLQGKRWAEVRKQQSVERSLKALEAVEKATAALQNAERILSDVAAKLNSNKPV